MGVRVLSNISGPYTWNSFVFCCFKFGGLYDTIEIRETGEKGPRGIRASVLNKC